MRNELARKVFGDGGLLVAVEALVPPFETLVATV
jgi:hypothetical protein